LSNDKEADEDEEKKTLNSFIKILTYAPSEEIFTKVANVFKTHLELNQKEVYEKFKDYLSDKKSYSLFKRPKCLPFDNNPLEGINNGIKAKVTNYVTRNVGVLLRELENDLKNRLEVINKERRLIFDKRLLIPHQFWNYAKWFSEICQDFIFEAIKRSNNSIKTFFLGRILLLPNVSEPKR